MKTTMRPLQDLCRFISGGTPSRKVAEYFNGEIPWVTGADLGGDGTVSPRVAISEAAIRSSNATPVDAGTILLVTRTSVGKVAVADRQLAFSQDVTGIVHDSSVVDRDYLAHYLRSKALFLSHQARGATIKGVTRAVVAALEVPVPSLPEQRRIAGILDGADSLCRKRQRTIDLVDELTHSAFNHMFGEDWGGTTTGVPLVPLGELVNDVKIGLSRSASEIGPSRFANYVRMDSIGRDGRLDLALVQKTDATRDEFIQYALEPGDFLFNTRNSYELVGKAAVFKGGDGYIYNNNIMRIRLLPGVLPDFIAYAWRSPFVQRQLSQRKRGTTSVFAIYWRDLKSVEIPVPPLARQNEFTNMVAVRDVQRDLMLHTKSAIDDLHQSIQSLAFSGGL